MNPTTRSLLAAIQNAFQRPMPAAPQLEVTGSGALRSVFPVTDLACASMAAAGLALADWLACHGHPEAPVTVDRRLASFWFRGSLRGEGWSPPPPWDAVAGDYRSRDGWIRLHTNAPHHRRAALAVLGVAGEREAVAGAVSAWDGQALEDAVVEAGGCAAWMRSRTQWAEHPQGRAVAAEPLLHIAARPPAAAPPGPETAVDPARPLRGIRVLDLTRVLAGPVATRTLAGFGATVLRIDPPGWQEPPIEPETTPGKRCARVDLRSPAGRDCLLALLADADVLVHGYRPGALEDLGLGEAARRRVRADLVDVCLDAYGWSGPWVNRRGFDSLVQMSVGIADAGMRAARAAEPRPLPVQALDHATGYLLAAAAIHGLRQRRLTGGGWQARASLARTAALLAAQPAVGDGDLVAVTDADWLQAPEQTGWGPARRLRPPFSVGTATLQWDRPARPLGGDPPTW